MRRTCERCGSTFAQEGKGRPRKLCTDCAPSRAKSGQGRSFQWNDGNDGRKPEPDAPDGPKVGEHSDGAACKAGSMPDGRAMIHCRCGHDYPYRIRRGVSAIRFLEGKPCKRCESGILPDADADGGSLPESETESIPEPETESIPEPETADIDAVLASWPRVPEGAVFHPALVDVLLLASKRIPVWMQGPPGTSKSTLGETVADALGLAFYPQSCRETMTDANLFGFVDAGGTYHRTPLRDAYEHGGVFVLDEVDNGNPNLTAALNSALSNGHCTFGDGAIIPRHPDFIVLANANTAGLGPESGYIGRMGVDLATRDRFVTVPVPIADDVEEAMAAGAMGEDISPMAARCARDAAKRLRDHAVRSLARPDAAAVIAAVRTVRDRVEARYRGSVVTPRCTLHAATMVTLGWTIPDAIARKLPGIDAAGIASVVDGIRP